MQLPRSPPAWLPHYRKRWTGLESEFWSPPSRRGCCRCIQLVRTSQEHVRRSSGNGPARRRSGYFGHLKVSTAFIHWIRFRRARWAVRAPTTAFASRRQVHPPISTHIAIGLHSIPWVSTVWINPIGPRLARQVLDDFKICRHVGAARSRPEPSGWSSPIIAETCARI